MRGFAISVCVISKPVLNDGLRSYANLLMEICFTSVYLCCTSKAIGLLQLTLAAIND